MKALQRTLLILASLFLLTQTARHAYVRWWEPRESALDRFDQPLKDEIAAAASMDDLVRRYEPIRRDVDRIKAERRAADPKARFEDEQDAEPFKSEQALRTAISSWEERAKQIHALRFYWVLGLLLAAVGTTLYRQNRWLGLALLIVGFAEMIFWTCPSFLGTSTREFDRLLTLKLSLSVISVAALVVVTRRLGAFRDDLASA